MTFDRATERMLAGALNRTKLAFVELGDLEPAAVIAGAEADGPLVPWTFAEGVPVELQDREARASSCCGTRSVPTATSAPSAVGAAMTFVEVVEYTLDELERLLAETRDG